MTEDDLNNEAFHGITERAKARMCSVGGIGTGNIVKFGERFYIATCRHVADAYYRESKPYIVLQGNKRIPTEKLEYVGWTNEDYDSAIIGIDKSVQIDAWYDESDFHVIEDFGTYPFQNENLFVCGFPEHLSYEREEGIFRMWMSYMTLPDDETPSDEDFLFAKYERDSEEHVTQAGLKTKLPYAPGLSGAFIFRVPQFAGEADTLWTPDYLRVIAIQVSWNQKTWIKGANVKHLLTLADKLSLT